MQFWENLKKQLKVNYEIIVIDLSTYAQKYRFVYSLRKILFYLLGPVFGIMLILILAIFFTPIRKLIPGYTDPEQKIRQQYLSKKVIEMENKIAQRDSVIKSILKITGSNQNNQIASDHSATQEQTQEPIDQTRNDAELSSDELANVSIPANFSFGMDYYYFVRPVTGFLTNYFSEEEKHYAIDLAAPQGATIHAVAPGYVIFADYTNETGHVIGIHHSDNFVSFYKHNRYLFNKVGSYVQAGDAIAIIGNSGENSTGPHLHFELWHHGKPVDPLIYINLTQKL